MSLNSLKKAVLAEVGHDYALFNRINTLFEVAEKAEAEKRAELEQKEQEKRKITDFKDFARKNRVVKG